MANLVKIKDVKFYTGLSETASDQFAAKKLLDDAGVKYDLMAYNDASQHSNVFSALSTWVWGPEKQNKQITQFPILHWTECFDDFETHVHVAHGLDEIKACTLLTNKDLIK